jgi:adenosylcobinamide-GDP ribazoletransferase
MLWAGPRLAVTLLTALPLPGRAQANTAPDGAQANTAPDGAQANTAPSRRAAAAAMYWAPAVGLLVGGLSAGILLLAARVGHTGPLLAAVLAVATGAVATRALHMDGLADFADGLGSGRPPGEALEIMRRSDIGPFGVVTLLLALLIQVSALERAQSLGRGPEAIVAAAVTARLAITVACRHQVPPARPGGLGALVAASVRPAGAAALTAVALAAAAGAGHLCGAGWLILPAGVAAGLAVSLGATALAIRRLGGITGDVLGALAELAATACLLVAALS